MELKDYVNVIAKKLWIIILIPFLACCIMAFITFFAIEPVYESSITLYVINTDSDSRISVRYEDILVSQHLAKDYREIIKSRSVTEDVIKYLNLNDVTPGELAKRISVSLKNDTRILEIKARDPNPAQAKIITDKIGEIFIKKATDIMGAKNISVVDSAQEPFAPVSPKPLVNILAAFITGLFAALGIVFFVEYVQSDIIKDSYDVEKHLNLKVLGIIPSFDIK